jgi:DNA-directed RNA polymerase specialized sigma24 family protein
MTTETGNIVLADIVPIIKATIPRTVTPVGSDDHEELVQDAIVSACQMAESLERSNRPIIASSVAYYAIQRTRSGRRSQYGGRADALCSAAIMDGNSAPVSIDACLDLGTDDADGLTLGDVLADHRDDPATLAARKLDWTAFMRRLPIQHRTVVTGTAIGTPSKDLAEALRVSPPRVTQIRREAGIRLRDSMGTDILAESTREIPWRRDLRCAMESAASRHECRGN